MITLPARPARRRNETRDLVRPILAALAELPGVWAARNNSGVLRDGRGVCLAYGLGTGSADVIGCVLTSEGIGRMLALEVKWPGKRPSEDQRRWLARLRGLGAYACVVHSVDEAVAAVQACGRGEWP